VFIILVIIAVDILLSLTSYGADWMCANPGAWTKVHTPVVTNQPPAGTYTITVVLENVQVHGGKLAEDYTCVYLFVVRGQPEGDIVFFEGRPGA